jgi:putative membrane protein
MTPVLIAVVLGGVWLAPVDPASTGANTGSSPSSSASSKASASQTSPSSDKTTAVLSSIHSTNQMEIQFGKLAQSNASSADVKAYGEQLVRDHQDADKKVQAVADQKGVTLKEGEPTDSKDAEAMAKQKAALTRLGSMKGEAFDKDFLNTMAEGHEHAIANLKNAKATEKDPAVTKLVDSLLPTLEKHRAMATDPSGAHASHDMKSQGSKSGETHGSASQGSKSNDSKTH